MISQYFLDAERNPSAIEGQKLEKLSPPFYFRPMVFPDLAKRQTVFVCYDLASAGCSRSPHYATKSPS